MESVTDDLGNCDTCGAPLDYMFAGDMKPSCTGCGNLPTFCDCGYELA